MLELLLASTRVVFILNWESLLRTCGATVNETTLGDITEYRNGYTISLIAAKTGEWMFKKYSEKVVHCLKLALKNKLPFIFQPNKSKIK